MSEEDQDGKLAARMARMKPSEAPKRRAGVNPYALSAVTAAAGVGIGAWLVLAAPEAPAPAPAFETASVSDFQGDGSGADGFTITKEKPQITPAAPDRTTMEHSAVLPLTQRRRGDWQISYESHCRGRPGAPERLDRRQNLQPQR